MNMTKPLERTAHESEEHASPQIEKTTCRLTKLNEFAATYIRANPGRCLLGAVAAGYVIGRVARRK
jgi:hypothetical protein